MGSSTRRQISLAASLLAAFVLTHQIIYSLSFLQSTVIPEVYLRRSVIALAGFLFPIVGGWMAYGLVGGSVFACFAAAMVFFVYGVSQASVILWFLAEYAGLCLLLYRIDEYFENQLADFLVDREKFQNEKNDLEVSYKVKGEGISILFEKYSTYYNLRKLAEELATTMSVQQLSQMVVERTTEFIPRGDIAILSLADSEGKNLSVMASKRMKRSAMSVAKQGDMFDFWSIRNRKRCTVADSTRIFVLMSPRLRGSRASAAWSSRRFCMRAVSLELCVSTPALPTLSPTMTSVCWTPFPPSLLQPYQMLFFMRKRRSSLSETL